MQTNLAVVMQQLQETPVVRDVWRGTFTAGDHIRQGDVLLVCPCSTGYSTVPTVRGNRPFTYEPSEHVLARGGETVKVAIGEGEGSQHVLDLTGVPENGVVVYAPKWKQDTLGPCIEIQPGCKALLTHPRHRHFELAAGTEPLRLQVVYEMDFLTNDRVED